MIIEQQASKNATHATTDDNVCGKRFYAEKE